MRKSHGHVYLVGAGPGDPDLITVKGLRSLREADVVIYDRLIPPSLLKRIPQSTRKIYVGKSTGWHPISQDEICKIMISEARSGKDVVRLKGGDPFLFGRGGEEALELRKAGIKFTIVPGVTSALAVPAYAGIPLTHRDYASSVAIVTGHKVTDTSKKPRVEWKKLATAVDTIVILMGFTTLQETVKELIRGGLRSNAKVAMVEWGTTRYQRTITGTLSNIVKKAASQRLRPPTVIVIGEVVRLRQLLDWYLRDS